MPGSFFFVNYPLETFTPTASGAIATIIHQVYRQARQAGLQPWVVTRRSDVAPYPDVQCAWVDPPWLPSGRWGQKVFRAQRKLGGYTHLRHPVYAARVVQAIRQVDTEPGTLLLFNDPDTVWWLRQAFPRTRIVHWFENQQTCKPRYQARFRQSVNLVCGVSDFTSRWLEQDYGLPAGSVRTLYNGVDPDAFTVPPPREGLPVVGFVGRTGIEKAPDVVLQAALKVAERTRDFKVQLVGSNHWDRFELDAYQRRLQGLRDELIARGIEVTLPGHIGREELPKWFHRAHIHVVPSRWDEPFGLTTLEGMASGCAVVASRTGGTPEVVGSAALLFERDQVDELAAHLLRLLEDQPLRRSLGEQARQRALRLTWQHTWQTLSGYCDL